MEAAREMAMLRNQGIGGASPDLARRVLTPVSSPAVEVQNGIPVWTHGLGAVSRLSYPNVRLSPTMALESLARFKAGFPGIHRFWPDVISLT